MAEAPAEVTPGRRVAFGMACLVAGAIVLGFAATFGGLLRGIDNQELAGSTSKWHALSRLAGRSRWGQGRFWPSIPNRHISIASAAGC